MRDKSRHITLNPGREYIFAIDDWLIVIAQGTKLFAHHWNCNSTYLDTDDLTDIQMTTRQQFEADCEAAIGVFHKQDASASPTFSIMSEIREEANIQTSPQDHTRLTGGFPPAPYGMLPARSHIYQIPSDVEEARIDGATDLKGHIIVCTPSFDIWTFVATMRYTDNMSRIVCFLTFSKDGADPIARNTPYVTYNPISPDGSR
jgi:hypothetical protein